MTEAELKAQIRLALGCLPGVRLFNNPVGDAWAGKVVHRDQVMLTLQHARNVTFGLAPGSGDLCGWTSVVVTSEMIGRRVAVFTSAEVKTDRGRVAPNQENWLRVVSKAGGIADVVRSPEDALRLVGAK